MQAYFNAFLKEIINKTNISVSIFDQDGNFVVGELFVKNINPDFDQIFVDRDCNLTLFKVNIKNKPYIFAISGTTETQKVYAVLIGEIAKSYFEKDVKLSRAEVIKSSAVGELSPSQIREFCKNLKIPDKNCFAVIVKTKSGVEEVLSVLNTIAVDSFDGVFTVSDNACALIRFILDGSDDQREFAEFIANSIYEETGVMVNVYYGSTVESLTEIARSYSQALFACTADEQSLVNLRVRSYKEFVLEKMLNELPKSKLDEYLYLLNEDKSQEIFSDQELVYTAECFLDNDLNVSETSRKMYLHRNTLIYRIDKIENATGLDIRKFSDALTFKLINLLNKSVK